MAQPIGYATHIAANGTTLLGGSANPHKILLQVTINTIGAGGNTLTIYDSLTASGTVIAGPIDLTVAIGTLLYDVVVTNGLTLVVATGTPADLTITSY